MTNKRIRKAQVVKLMDEVSKMECSTRQYHDLEKAWNPHRERYAWRVKSYSNNGYFQPYMGDTLAEVLETLVDEREGFEWNAEQKRKWEAEQI